MQEVSGATIGQASGASAIELEEQRLENPPVEVASEPSRPSFFNKLLTAKTGEGSLESYTTHPLNFNGSEGMNRIIRGATGLLGSLDLAIIDIGFGLLEFWKHKPKAPTVVPVMGDGIR